MARLALTVVGLGVGAFFGMPALGAAVGGVLGSLLFPPEGTTTTAEGPRLSDMSVMSSAYGVPVARGYGTFRIAGNVIWSPGLKEHKITDTQTVGGGKGGGGSTSTNTSYVYTSSFSVCLGRGVITDILTIWADSKIIYDKTGPMVGLNERTGVTGTSGGLPNTITTQLTVGNGTSTRKVGLTFRHYPGDYEQIEDPAIDADPRIVAGHAPAFRGRSHIVFEDYDLTDHGNRIPQISCLVTYANLGIVPYQSVKTISTPTGGSLPGLGTVMAPDWQRNSLYAFHHEYNTPEKLWLVAYDARTFAMRKAVDWTGRVLEAEAFNQSSGSGGGVGLIMAPDGYLYSLGEVHGSANQILKIDPVSLQQVAESFLPTGAEYVSGFDLVTQRSTIMVKLGYIACYGLSDIKVVILGASLFSQLLAGFAVQGSQISLIWYDGFYGARQIGGDGILGMLPYNVGRMIGNTFIVEQISNTGIKIWDASVTATVSASYTGDIDEQVGVNLNLLALVTWDDVAASAGISGTGHTSVAASGSSLLDVSDQGVVHWVKINSGQTIAFKWRHPSGIVWTALLSENHQWPLNSQSFLNSGIHTWVTSSTIYSLDLASGILTTRVHGASLPLGGIDTARLPQIYLPSLGIVVTHGGSAAVDPPTGYSNQLVSIYVEAGGGAGLSVAACIQDLCLDGDLLETDLDLTDILGLTVPGYFIARPSSIRADIQPLLDAFAIDAMDSGDKLVFRARGHASVRTITQDELCVTSSGASDGEWLTETITSETDLPSIMSVTFADPATAYQQMTVQAARTTKPVRAVLSNNSLSITVPIAWEALAAKRRAEVLLFTAWTERFKQAWATTWKHMDMDPTDVVTLSLDDGLTIVTRNTKVTLGGDWTVEVQGTTQGPGSYTASAQVAPASVVPYSQRLPSVSSSRIVVFDLPLLVDAHDTGGAGSAVYVAALGYDAYWVGATIYSSSDNVSFDRIATLTRQPSWGITDSALPDNVEPFSWDTENEIVATFAVDQSLGSTTDDDVLTNFANAFAIQNEDGNWEIIQAVSVVANADGTTTLSRLLRGRRGTDVFCAGHYVGATIIALKFDGSITMIVISAADIDSTKYYKAVTIGRSLQETSPTATITHGVDLKPYMPRDVIALVDMSGNIDLTWLRRTRVSGELRSGIGSVPLGEESEAYEFDVLDGPGGAVVETLTSATEAATYDTADVTADFGGVPLTLTLKAYQMSATVGRGLSREITVEVN